MDASLSLLTSTWLKIMDCNIACKELTRQKTQHTPFQNLFTCLCRQSWDCLDSLDHLFFQHN